MSPVYQYRCTKCEDGVITVTTSYESHGSPYGHEELVDSIECENGCIAPEDLTTAEFLGEYEKDYERD